MNSHQRKKARRAEQRRLDALPPEDVSEHEVKHGPFSRRGKVKPTNYGGGREGPTEIVPVGGHLRGDCPSPPAGFVDAAPGPFPMSINPVIHIGKMPHERN